MRDAKFHNIAIFIYCHSVVCKFQSAAECEVIYRNEKLTIVESNSYICILLKHIVHHSLFERGEVSESFCDYDMYRL